MTAKCCKNIRHGRSDRIRTCGILLPKQARYQLRYTPIFYFAFFLKFSVFPCFVRPLAKLSPMAPLCNAMRSVLLRFLRLPASATGSGRLRHPKQARYQLRYTPIFYFAFFLIFLSARHTANTSRSRHLCYFNISGRVCQADDWAGNCGCSIPTYAYAKKNTTALAHAGAVVFFGG